MLNEEWAYEKGNVEDGDSGGDIHTDGGTDRNGHYIVHGRLRPDSLVKSEGCVSRLDVKHQ